MSSLKSLTKRGTNFFVIRTHVVIQGCAQRPGFDYEDTFSPVTRLDTIRTLLAVAAIEKMELMQFDVSTAFLYGDVKEEIYMKQPMGYSDGVNRVCCLNRSLHGLKQASRCWNRKFYDFMLNQKFERSCEDPCVYIRNRASNKIVVALYEDDGIVASINCQDMQVFVSELRSQFKIIAKELTYFLGIEISQINGEIALGQSAFLDRIFEWFNMSKCNLVSTPIEKLGAAASGKDVSNFPYRSAVGALLYLAQGARFDIAFAVGVLSYSLEEPTIEDVDKIKRVMRHLAGTKNLRLVYKHTSCVLKCFSDADFAGCDKTY